MVYFIIIPRGKNNMPKEKILEEKPDFSANVRGREITEEIQQSYLD